MTPEDWQNIASMIYGAYHTSMTAIKTLKPSKNELQYLTLIVSLLGQSVSIADTFTPQPPTSATVKEGE
jgi:hypothetical protein